MARNVGGSRGGVRQRFFVGRQDLADQANSCAHEWQTGAAGVCQGTKLQQQHNNKKKKKKKKKKKGNRAARTERLVGVNVVGTQRQVAGISLANNGRQALEGPQVGHHARLYDRGWWRRNRVREAGMSGKRPQKYVRMQGWLKRVHNRRARQTLAEEEQP